jgi:DNA-binding transcriptional LysR family regulator
MHGMNSERFDLNLLVVFDAVAQTGSVTAAASRLTLSQPAISHALNRLRDMVGDPLFVRSRNALVPTPRAQAMIDPIRSIVEAARGVVLLGAFDPGTSERAFRVGGSDFSMQIIVPALVRLLRAQAPRSTLDLVPIESRTLASLESGELDCSFWGSMPPGAPYLSRTLFRESFTGVVGRQHPLADKARQGTLTLDDYLAYPHAMARFRIPGQSTIDAALAELGRSRTIGYASPNFTSNAAALLNSDLVMSVPSRLAATFGDRDLILFELPFEVPSFPYSLIWHRRTDADPGCSWLREMAVRAARNRRGRKLAR